MAICKLIEKGNILHLCVEFVANCNDGLLLEHEKNNLTILKVSFVLILHLKKPYVARLHAVLEAQTETKVSSFKKITLFISRSIVESAQKYRIPNQRTKEVGVR